MKNDRIKTLKVKNMKITILVDNNTQIDNYYLSEPGVSYYIETENRKILFDVGFSDVFLKNAESLNCNLLNCTDIVFSHGHLDHTWGIDFLIRKYKVLDFKGSHRQKPNLICHPYAIRPKFTDDVGLIGNMISIDILKNEFNLIKSKSEYSITQNIFFLGEIPEYFDFEERNIFGKTIDDDGELIPDYLIDDSALVISTPQGIGIITGCSHSGICNIIEHAKRIANQNNILFILGGFHLIDASLKKQRKVAQYIDSQSIEFIYPCHCTGREVIKLLSDKNCVCDVFSGMAIRI